MQIEIDNEDNWCLTQAEMFKLKIDLWLDFLASFSKPLPHGMQQWENSDRMFLGLWNWQIEKKYNCLEDLTNVSPLGFTI